MLTGCFQPTVFALQEHSSMSQLSPRYKQHKQSDELRPLLILHASLDLRLLKAYACRDASTPHILQHSILK